MRIRDTIVAAGLFATSAAVLLVPSKAAAQGLPPVTPLVQRDTTWGTVSNITTLVGVGIVTLMPRVYYNDPEATVGWKGRWHVSMLAPALAMTTLTLFVDGPLKNAIKSPRPGCAVDNTLFAYPGTNCETYGSPSTQSYASWGATGMGTGIFLVDTLRYSQAKFHAGGFVGNVAVPLVLSVFTSVGRAVQPGTSFGYESGGQVALGALTGFATGALVGVGYAFFQRPNCGYGNSLVCW